MKRNTAANALRRGRFSLLGANYFVTICVEPRITVLESVAVPMLSEIRRMTADHSWRMRCMTIMPDHVHLLFTLGERLTLSQCVARLKWSGRRIHCRDRPVRWQENFYDHRLRPHDSIEATIRYIWLNPYVAGLISEGEKWKYFWCCGEDWEWFKGTTDRGLPFPEWLREA